MADLEGLKTALLEMAGFATTKREGLEEIDNDDGVGVGVAMPMSAQNPTKLVAQPKLLSSTKDQEMVSEIMKDGFINYGLPAALVGVGATFLLRRRYVALQSSTPEKVLLSALHYYGASSLGMGIGFCLFGPTFNKRVLETMPNSDLARAIRAEKSKKMNS